MAAIVIKEEKPDLDESNTPSLKGGGGGDDKKKQEKTQAALKVVQKTNYRLKRDNWSPQTLTTTTVKKGSNGLLKVLEGGGLKKANIQQNRRLETENNSSRCGEIFVTNNANKWTFVCTYCQKSTRDIGEFVCHIKFKHMDACYNDDDIDERNETQIDQKDSAMDECYNQGQDYFDCGNYLDVNVHTEDSDELSYKNQTNEIKSEATKKGNDVVNLLDDDDDDGREMIYDYDYEGAEDYEDGVHVIDDIDHSNEQQQQHIVEDDKQLLLRRASLDEESNNDDLSGCGVKKYRSHVRGTAYCKLCDKTFQYYSLYRNHMIKHSNVTPYKCQFCDKGFKSKQAIRYHMKTHSKEKQFRCPICSTSYATSSLFMSHVLSHESENCYPCMVCAKILTTEQEREEHLETHSEERPYCCNYCNKRFRQKHHLSNHLKLHCQYRCDFCRESFSSTQTQRRPYACQTCEEMPEIRQQVERQRSLSLKPADVPPIEFENIMIAPINEAATECVNLDDMASDGDESEGSTSTSMLVSTANNNHLQCKYCLKHFTHTGALKFHLQQKHSQHYN